jgi:hypothetical protein
MKRPPLSFLLRLTAIVCFLPGAVLAQDDGSSIEGGVLLLFPIGAEAISMGRAMTALASAESVFWNPAGLGEAAESRMLAYRGDNIVGESTALSGLFSRAGIGAIGVSYNLLDAGEQESTDDQGNVVGTISNRNHLAVVSVATRFLDRLNVGVNFKVLQFRQSCRGLCLGAGVTATTYAVDGGVQLTQVAGLPLRLGAMLAHVGPRLQFHNEEQADPLPTRVRFAAAYEVAGPDVPGTELTLAVTGEVEDRWRDPGSPAVYLGGEFSATVEQALLQLRAGYVWNGPQVDGAAVGVGIRYNRFDLGIAKSLAANIAQDVEPVHVSFGLTL